MSFPLVEIGECCNIINGSTPSRNKPEYWGGEIDWFTPKDLSKIESKYIDEAPEKITEQGYKSCSTTIVPIGSLLYTSRAPIGHLAINKREVCTNQGFKTLIPNEGVDVEFLYYALKKYTPNLQYLGNGATFKELSKATISKFKIPLPPLPIQKKIAAILDAADAYRQKTKALIEKYDELAQSLFLDMFGDPVRNEKGWEKKTIEDLVKKEKYAIKRGPFGGALKKEIFVDAGYLVYEQYHALNNDFKFGRYFIDEDKFQELKGFEVHSGDIIISCSGVYLGKLAIVPVNATKGIINQALLKVSLDQSKMRNLLFTFIFQNQSFRNKFFGTTRGSGIPNFPPMSRFKEFQFIWPPINKQVDFEKRVDQIFDQKLKAQSTLEKAEELFQSLLQKAFKGELVV